MKEKIIMERIPQHIAVIMDGNGRWAKKQGMARVFGHKNAVKAVRDITEGAGELGVKFLTLYAFSTENWNRPKEEVFALMELLSRTIKSEVPNLHKNNVRVTTIGNTEQLPKDCREELQKAMEVTKYNTGLTLVLALSYSGRREIIDAAKRLAEDAAEGKINSDQIDDALFSSYLHTNQMPDPELIIRTSGEFRLSNFLLWQLAYSELYFTDVLWPDFRKEHLYQAVLDYQSRERRFGKTSEQVSV
ncbi:MAG: isoprenyl transferase [Thermoflexibacteraceae bacterium]